MQSNQEPQPQTTTNADNLGKQSNATDQSTSHDQPSNLAPKYNDAGIYATRPNPSTQPKPPARPNHQPVSAAALSAVLATSSSSTDKMHSQSSSSRKVENWNEDPTYKSRLASMVGSTRKWNYFGADVGGNPFRRRSGGKK